MERTQSQNQKKFKEFFFNSQIKLNNLFDKEPHVFHELTKVFNIFEGQAIEAQNKLKQRLINICLQEKQEYLQYLSLPKFKQISQYALEILISSLKQIWQLIKQQQQLTERQSIQNKINRYIPSMKSLKQVQSYHLRILQMYEHSELCPFSKQIRKNSIRSSSNKYCKDYSEFQERPNYLNHQSVYTNKNFTSVKGLTNLQNSDVFSPSYTNFWNIPREIIQTDKERIQQCLLTNYQENCQSFSESRNFQTFHKNHSFKHSKQINLNNPIIEESHFVSSGDHIKKEYQKASEQNNVESFIQEFSHVRPNSNSNKITAIDPHFRKCICKGKISKAVEETFLCELCNYKFHFQCLRIESRNHRICPVCTVQQTNSPFFQLIKNPLTSDWILNHPQNESHKLILTKQVLDKMKVSLSKQNRSILLKLITIIKSTQGFQNNIKQEKQQEPLKSQYSQQQEQSFNNKGSTQRFSTIQLPRLLLQNLIKCEKPTLLLNFDTETNSKDRKRYILKNKGKNNKKQQKLVYYGIYQIERKSYEKVLQQLYQSCKQQNTSLQKLNIINQFYAQHQNQQLTFTPKSQNYPCRGTQCKHLETFDLGKLFSEDLNHLLSNKKRRISPQTNIICPICNRQIKELRLDKKLKQLLDFFYTQTKQRANKQIKFKLFKVREGLFEFVNNNKIEMRSHQNQQQLQLLQRMKNSTSRITFPPSIQKMQIEEKDIEKIKSQVNNNKIVDEEEQLFKKQK